MIITKLSTGKKKKMVLWVVKQTQNCCTYSITPHFIYFISALVFPLQKKKKKSALSYCCTVSTPHRLLQFHSPVRQNLKPPCQHQPPASRPSADRRRCPSPPQKPRLPCTQKPAQTGNAGAKGKAQGAKSMGGRVGEQDRVTIRAHHPTIGPGTDMMIMLNPHYDSSIGSMQRIEPCPPVALL